MYVEEQLISIIYLVLILGIPGNVDYANEAKFLTVSGKNNINFFSFMIVATVDSLPLSLMCKIYIYINCNT